MFLQLLASALLKAPEIHSDVAEAEAKIGAHLQPKTADDLEALTGIAFRRYQFEEDSVALNLRRFEDQMVRAKHLQSTNDELEEDFV